MQAMFEEEDDDDGEKIGLIKISHTNLQQSYGFCKTRHYVKITVTTVKVITRLTMKKKGT